MEITSSSNEKVKAWQKLKQKKYRDLEGLFLIEDEHLINEALNHHLVKEIITNDSSLTYPISTYYVSEHIMKLLTDQVSGAKVIGVCKKIKEKEIKGNLIILDNIQDPGNLGTIIRSAVAFNFETLVLSSETVDIYNPKVIRATEGMLFNLNIIRTDIVPFLKNLDSTYLKVTTDVIRGKDIKEIKEENIALVIGNEGQGVRKEVASLCDEKVHLEMTKICESLNAGVSASILMYEVFHG